MADPGLLETEGAHYDLANCQHCGVCARPLLEGVTARNIFDFGRLRSVFPAISANDFHGRLGHQMTANQNLGRKSDKVVKHRAYN